MGSLKEIRNKYPQYNDMNDQEFADKFHDKFYSDIPKDQFYQKIGFEQKKPTESLLQKAGNFARKNINEPIEDIGHQALNMGAGAAQGVANTGAGTRNLMAKIANLIPGVNIPMAKSVDIAPKNINSLAGEFGGSVLGGGAIQKGLNLIPSVTKGPAILQKIVNSVKNIGSNALTGAAMVPDDQGIGAALGAGGAALGKGISSVANNPFVSSVASNVNKIFHKGPIEKELLYGLNPKDKRTLERIQANKELGTKPTISEITGSPVIGKKEGKLARTEAGGQRMYDESLSEFENQQSTVNKLLSGISSENKVAAPAIRSAANKYISKMEKTRNDIVEPVYKEANKKKVAPTKIISLERKDPVIKNALDYVMEHPTYAVDLEGNPRNSIKALDLAQRRIRDQIDSAGSYTNEGRLLIKSRERLLSAMDQYSKDHKLARDIYRTLSGPIDTAKESQLGRIGNLSDVQLKNVSKMIFDPNQSDIRVLEEMRDRIRATDPKSWDQIVRNEIERLTKGSEGGKNFYNNVLKNKNVFKQFEVSLEHKPKELKTLRNMKKGWDQLIGMDTARTAFGSAAKNTSAFRVSIEYLIGLFKDFTGSKRDLEKIRYLRSPKFEHDLEIMSRSNPKSKERIKNLSNIFGKIFPASYESIKDKE